MKLKTYGTSETYKWFESYLHGRQQFVSFSGKVSTSRGVPHGSILAQLLFIFYIQSTDFESDLYAYDTNAIGSELQRKLNRAWLEVEEKIIQVNLT